MTLLKGKRIFIVEDNLQNRVIFQMALMQQGAQVDFERSGHDTIYRLTGMSNVDLIILDLMLKDNISGFDLYDEIRALPELSSVPIIAVSAMDPAVAVPQVREKGFSGFIAKPIDNRLFPKQIAAIIEGESIWDTGQGMLS
jgi:CheY-like chemotaxis protein